MTQQEILEELKSLSPIPINAITTLAEIVGGDDRAEWFRTIEDHFSAKGLEIDITSSWIFNVPAYELLIEDIVFDISDQLS